MITQNQSLWWRNAVVYQIYPRSFCDSNGDGIGDLNGITSKLDYLKKLGVDILWLSPVYQSPGDDNGYDISDYRAINPEFGTMEDFDRMLAEAHARGIRIVMDLVVNHTSDEHTWFLESRSSRENPKREYYIWRDADSHGNPPNRWASAFGGPAWEWDPAGGQYYLHLFSRKQPDLNWDNPSVREEVFDMMTWWCEKGIDGFRMDVISMISKPEGLPDGPEMPGGFTASTCCNGPHLHQYLQQMNERVLSRYPLVTVGECPGAGIEEAVLFTDPARRELDMVFQFEHVSGSTRGETKYDKWDRPALSMPELREVFSKWQYGLEGRGWNSLYLDNHDQPRCVSRFGDDSPQYRVLSAKMLATCLHFMKGTPYIYQGEELGMTNACMTEIGQYRDIESLRTYDFLTGQEGLPVERVMGYLQAVSRDNARTPMQWDSSANAGFTDGTPWIGVNPNYTEINAAAQTDDETSVFSYYRELIRLRHTLPVMVEGRYELLQPDNSQVFAYTRTGTGACQEGSGRQDQIAHTCTGTGDPAEKSRICEKETLNRTGEKLLVFCNFTREPAPLPAEASAALGAGACRLIGNYPDLPEGQLRPYEALVLHLS